MSGRRAWKIDVFVALTMFIIGTAISGAAMRHFRAAGMQPSFYQGNFEAAVQMTCGNGFRTTTFAAIPQGLRDFLSLKRNTFDCAELPESLPLIEVTWNGTWYYLYGTTSLIWRMTGISWTALDGLVAVMGGITTASLYGLFRLVAWRWLAMLMALVLTIAPSNLTYLLYLRDYSKGPLVLLATFVLAVLIVRPMSNRATIGMAALFGAVVGIGYGFRTDLMIMVPFGIAMVALLLPGALKPNLLRNATAAAVVLVTFLIAAAPPLRGLKTGGCQFHYSLLGLTTPLARQLGMRPALYNFGDHFTDTFVDLKVGDYAHRALSLTPPNLCDPNYDVASGELFTRMALTFPADLVAHAYGSVLTILQSGQGLAHLGVIVTVLAVFASWMISTRLGIALTAFVLFLCGYPAIEFEARHWFHLRFIPWWMAAMVAGHAVRTFFTGVDRTRLRRAAAGVAVLFVLLATSLAAFRVVQAGRVRSLISSYEAAATEMLSVGQNNGTFLPVRWEPLDYGDQPNHRSSDLMVLTLDPARCAGSGDLAVHVRYDTDNEAHDLNSMIPIRRPPPGDAPTHLYVPVFAIGFENHTYLRFVGFTVEGASTDCISRVARISDRARLPLWLEARVAPDWSSEPLYQGIQMPRLW